MIKIQNRLCQLRYALILNALIIAAPAWASDTDNPFLGHWALTTPGGGAGWLGVTQEKGYYDANILWGAGSVLPVASVFFNDNKDTLFVTRLNEVKRKDASGKVVRTQQFTEAITAKVSGDEISLTRFIGREDGEGIITQEFSGKRIAPVPPAPDLSQIKFGAPIALFNGKDLDGWKLTAAGQVNGWSAQDGVLINRPVQQEG